MSIIPARYLNTSVPEELAKHCMEDLDAGFVSNVAPGDILVAEPCPSTQPPSARRSTVGSSPKTSSPTSASAMWRRMMASGR